MAITIVSDSVLIESRSARDYQLERISPERALEIINKAKALIVALWQGTGVTTTEEIARYFEVESSVVRHASKQHRDELLKDGWREVKGQENLKALRSIGSEVFSLPSATTRIAIWTPRAALRLAMILRDSDVAKAVRTCLLDAVEQVIPAQSARIRELELARAQAFAAQSQERLMQATNAIANLHGIGMVALILGKPDAVITHTEVIEKTVAVDPKTGRVLAQSDGMTIGYLTKRLGFKNNDQTWQWLNSVQLGKDSGAWSRELTAHPTLKLPRHFLPQVQRLFAYQMGNRQLLLGEGGGR